MEKIDNETLVPFEISARAQRLYERYVANSDGVNQQDSRVRRGRS